MSEINEEVVKKFLAASKPGLVAEVGDPIPGHMCVMSAISFVTEYKDENDIIDDHPLTAHSIPTDLAIALNDNGWKSKAARARGMQAVGVAIMGSRDIHGDNFLTAVMYRMMTELLPHMLREVFDAKTVEPYIEKLRKLDKEDRTGAHQILVQLQDAIGGAPSAGHVRTNPKTGVSTFITVPKRKVWDTLESIAYYMNNHDCSDASSAFHGLYGQESREYAAKILVEELKNAGSKGAQYLNLLEE